MPSSSWHLIRGSGSEASPDERRSDPLESSTCVDPAPANLAGQTASAVLRGRGRSSLHPASKRDERQTTANALVGAGLDPIELAEEVRRIERAAEDRGYETGRNRAEAELRASVEAAGALAERLQSIAPERTSEIAHAVAELALSVARRIIQHEVRIEPSMLCAALEAAITTINGSPEARVLLNPAAVAPVAEAWEALHGRAHLGKHWIFEGDPNLPAGGCTVRYDHGFVEAGLEAQLEEIGIALDRAIPNLARTTIEEEVA